jgi:chromosome segregation ATPase
MKQENDQLKMENEELRAELNRTQMAATVLDEVGILMDSIDQARNALKLDLEAGTSYEDYLTRMEEINDYVKESELKISELEQEIAQSSTKNQSYINSIARLKRDLKSKTEEVAELKNTVESYKGVNQELLNLVNLQESELADMEADIDMKQEELDLLENRIQELMVRSQMSEADAYFARAEAVEEAANRTKLAKKKKKATLQEALELYKKALAYGREDAEEKIKELETKI